MCKPLVSIIVLVYNVEPWLSRALDSCINQTYTALEILVVNDGSSDGSKNVIDHYMLNDCRIKCLNKNNGGANSARKAGIEEATGAFITILDGDDFLDLEAIDILVNSVLQTEVDIVIGGMNYVVESSGKLIRTLTHSRGTMTMSGYIKAVLNNGHFSTCAKLYRSSVVKNKVKFPVLNAWQDFPLTIQWGLYSNKVSYIDIVIYNYVISRKGSITNQPRKAHFANAFESYHYTFKNILSQHKLASTFEFELVSNACRNLYLFYYHYGSGFRPRKADVMEIRSFIVARKQMIRGYQFHFFMFLLKYSSRLSHLFILGMQRLKPTISIDFK